MIMADNKLEYNFILKPDEALKCSICLEVARGQPMEVLVADSSVRSALRRMATSLVPCVGVKTLSTLKIPEVSLK